MFSKLVKLKNLYIFFLILALLNVFFSTEKSNAKTFLINEIEISTPFNDSFDKNEIINKSFVKAYNQLILSTVQSALHLFRKRVCLKITSESGSR